MAAHPYKVFGHPNTDCSLIARPCLYPGRPLSACGKGKPTDVTPPPTVARTCRITNYSTNEDLGGNGSQFGFSYDQNLNMVQVTAFQLSGYPGVKVKIGANGVNRDNGSSIVVWEYTSNIYTQRPSVVNYTLTAGSAPQKEIENLKYDNQNRLTEADILDANTLNRNNQQ